MRYNFENELQHMEFKHTNEMFRIQAFTGHIKQLVVNQRWPVIKMQNQPDKHNKSVRRSRNLLKHCLKKNYQCHLSKKVTRIIHYSTGTFSEEPGS